MYRNFFTLFGVFIFLCCFVDESKTCKQRNLEKVNVKTQSSSVAKNIDENTLRGWILENQIALTENLQVERYKSSKTGLT